MVLSTAFALFILSARKSVVENFGKLIRFLQQTKLCYYLTFADPSQSLCRLRNEH